MGDDNTIILELLRDLKKGQEEQRYELKETRESVSNLERTVALELQKINKLDEEQNSLLADHAKRSNELERQNDLLAAKIFGAPIMSIKQKRETIVGRLEALEEPGKWWKMTKKKIVGLAGLLTAGGVILGAALKFFGMF